MSARETARQGLFPAVSSPVGCHCETSPQTGRGNPLPKRLFLTGPSGCGKSTLLRTGLGSRRQLAGGFITDRALDADGRYAYFYLCRADGSGAPEIFLDLRQKPPVKHNRTFTVLAAEILQERPTFALLDEIGGMELLLPEFQAALQDFLASKTPCIGVLKGLQNGAALTKTAGLPEAYLEAAAALHRQLEADTDTQIVEIEHWDDPRAKNLIAQWVEEYAHA